MKTKQTSKKRILTGDRPTGPLHLGHFVGSLSQRVELQDEYETFILIADVQALTDNYQNPEKVRNNVNQLMLDYLSVGIDPEKATIYIQSMVGETAELTMFFANLVSVQRLAHNPTVKSEIKEKGMDESTPLGFYMYPVSQAADISIVRSHLIPVGEDQIPMVEQNSEIVKKFNKMYGEVFPIPKAKVTDYGRLVGLDGNSKMSKSLNNSIYLQDDADTVNKKVKSMYTDPTRIKATDPGKVEGNPVFIYHDAFNSNTEEVKELKERYKKGKVGDVEVKDKLAAAINEFLAPIHERRAKYLAMGDGEIREMLMAGTEKTRKVAAETMRMVREAMKIDY